MHRFSNVYLVSEKLDRVLASQVDHAEKNLEAIFPEGYREYVTNLGIGMFCDYLYVCPPQKIVEEASDYQNVFKNHLWSTEDSAVKKEDLDELIVFALTVDADRLAFHPRNPNQIARIPYNDEVIHTVGSSLLDSLEWLRNYANASDFTWFNSGVNQSYVHMTGGNEAGLIEKFGLFVRRLNLNPNIRSNGLDTWFLLRSINGYVVFTRTSSDSIVNVSSVFDKENSAVVEAIIGFFEERAFSITAKGDKKK